MAKQVEVPELKNINEAINWIMSNVGYVQKKTAKNLTYTFAGEAALIQAVRPWMVLAGVTMYVAKVSNKVREQYETKSGTTMNSITLDAVIVFMHTASGTYIEVMSSGEGADTGDKASNKALTGAYKYAIRQTFCIETGDDPDEHSSEKMERKKPETVEQAKARLVRELKDYYKDGAAVAAAMKIEPVITFDLAKFNDIKAELIKRAEAKNG
jgi:hypothetical protein